MFSARFSAVAGLLLAGLVWPAEAQDDEPGRGVVRISVLNGDVSVRRGDSGDLVAAAVNAPLVVEDRLLTGLSSRAELQFDWANFLRVSSNAEVRLAELGNARYLVQVARGTVTWRVLRDADAYIEISTPAVSVRPVRRGAYRVTVLDDGTVEITVRSGEAEIFTPRGSERLKSGRTMLARSGAADPEFRTTSELPEDDWDRWNVTRDRDLERSRSYQYMSRDIYGAEDLDHHGRWVNVAPYGYVWTPRVVVGWAPYRHGRWAWMDWYGWTWVSHDPWGWAPYHYGRWFHSSAYGWCWWPGAVHVRHRWSPGLVAFFGSGRTSIGFGWGRVGWVPVGPHEPFHPWWGRRYYSGYRGRNYVDNSVTVVNNVNITNVYRNSRIGDAVTIVDADGFRRGRSSGHIRYGDSDLRSAALARGPLPVTPERESLRFADRETGVRSVASRENERFFSNRRPSVAERVPFEDQRRGVEQIARRSFADGPVSGADASANRAPERVAEQRGWRRAESEAAGRSEGAAGDTARTTSDGWRRFGSARTVDSNSFDAGRSAGRGSAADNPGDGWTRFGAVRGSERTGRSSTAEGSGARGSAAAAQADDGWRRFGGRSEGANSDSGRGGARGFADRSESSGAESRPGNAEGWRSFGRGGSSVEGNGGARGQEGRRPSEGSGRSELNAEPRRSEVRSQERGIDSGFARPPESRSERSMRSDWGGARRGGGDAGVGSGERIRISPPIVRERSGMESGGSGARSMPGGGDRGGGGGGRGDRGAGAGMSRGGGGRGR